MKTIPFKDGFSFLMVPHAGIGPTSIAYKAIALPLS
jgi:hypothetical protein